MSVADETVFCFDGHTLDLRRGCLRNGQGEVELRPKCFELLRYLVENAGRLVSRDELADALWPDVIVTDESLSRCVADLRLALDDTAKRIIRTVRGRGFLLAVPVSQGLLETPPPIPPPQRDEPIAERRDTGKPGLEQRPAERRQLTVMATELVGLAGLSARLDPEDLREVTSACHRYCTEIIERHQGYVAHYSGDSILAYFGYPRAQEHETERAVQAGLALAEGVPGLVTAAGFPFQARIGIATGLVVVGDLIGGTLPEQAVVGEAPSLAQRLRLLAEPGAVVISSGTRRLTGGLFEYRDLGAAALAASAESVFAWQVLGAGATMSRFEALRASTTPLVGRDEEMELLLRRWERAKTGEGSVVLISGEPGIGKSRLAQSLLDELTAEPHTRVRCFCSPHHQDSALWPAITQIERAAGIRRGDSAEQKLAKLEAVLSLSSNNLREAVPMYADLLSIPTGDRYPPLNLTPYQHKDKALRTVLAQIEGLAASRPVAVLHEDIHWSDPMTREALDLLIDRTATLRALVILTFRPEFLPPWVGRPHVTLLSLTRLLPRDRARMILHVTGGKPLPKEIADQITDRTDGVPLFIEELTKSVVESGWLEDTGDRWAATGPVRSMAIPTSLQASLLARLDRLASTREVVQIAAALGRKFSHERISAIATMPQQELETSLAQLVQAELIYRRGTPPDAEYSFKHALVRDAAYSTLVRGQRQHLHGQIAAALRDRFPETRETEPELLAYHLTESGAIAEAIPLWTAAGQRAAARAAHAEAVAHLQTALDLLRRQSEGEVRARAELQLLLGLAVSLAALQGYAVPEVGEVLTEARAICEGLGEIDGLFAVQRGLFNFWIIAGELTAAEETARRCIAIGEQTGRPEHRIEGACSLGYVLWAKGELTPAEHQLERAVRLYAEHDGARLTFPAPQDSLIVALGALGLLRYARGDDAAAARTFRDLAAHGRALGRVFDLAFALSWNARFELMTGNFARALEFAEEALAICEAHGYATWRAITSVSRAAALGHLGEPDRAIGLAAGGLAELKRLGTKHGHCYYIGELAGLQAAAGDMAAALSTIDAAIAYALHSGDRFFLSPLHRRRAEILAGLPGIAPAEVAAALHEAIEIALAQGATSFARQAEALLAGRRASSALLA